MRRRAQRGKEKNSQTNPDPEFPTKVHNQSLQALLFPRTKNESGT